ncbi:MAG: hypothetical protein AB7O73_14535, partial [Bacteroidia bacterium]
QNTTINKSKKKESYEHNVMLVPFEPKLYNSEIDYHINKETNLSGKEIKFQFRDGLNEQIYKAFKKKKIGVIDLLEDTVKYRKEMYSIYSNLSYEYMKVPDQKNYKAPKKEKKQNGIEKGQLNVETNSDERFMNAKVTNAKLVPLLYGKHKTDVFVFINQLDIKAGTLTPDLNGYGPSDRKIIVHYTVYSYDAKELNSGISETNFPQSLNVPSKISTKYFSLVAEQIADRVYNALYPPKK